MPDFTTECRIARRNAGYGDELPLLRRNATGRTFILDELPAAAIWPGFVRHIQSDTYDFVQPVLDLCAAFVV